MAVVVHPLNVDVEAALVAALTPSLPGVRVATQVPRTKTGIFEFPDSLVVVARVGGVRGSVAHDRPVMLAQCWHTDKARAAQLAGTVRAAMFGLDNTLVTVPPLAAGDPVERVFVSFAGEAGGPVDYPDPRTDKTRYQFTHEVLVRRDAREL